MQTLPIDAVRDDLRRACRSHNRMIVTAPTGSGKSTRVPCFIADELPGAGRIVCLQPRRLPARMLSARVARERGVALGDEVGYRVRFDHRVCRNTRIVYETDGILLQDLGRDGRLEGTAALVFDEFHERHLFGDVLLGAALELQRGPRPDLLIVVMSATLDAAALEEFLRPCALVAAHGRCFPVEIQYQPAVRRARMEPVWDAAAAACAQMARVGPPGHTLIFMPGGYEIRRTVRALNEARAAAPQRIFPLYGELSPAAQDAAVAEDGVPRVIVATNIAETSITIAGVTRVIDCGLVRRPGYDPHCGINTLLLEKISRASADQRAGRAGRTVPGICRRLWTEDEHAARPARDIPEVERLDLSEVVLRLRALGCGDLAAFPWFSLPSPERLEEAERFLRDMGALDHVGGLTDTGRRMLEFPLHPRWSRLLLTAGDFDCVGQAALAAALAQERSVMRRTADAAVRARRMDLADPEWESDMLVCMRAWEQAARRRFDHAVCAGLGLDAAAARRVGELHAQFCRLARQQGLRIAPAAATPAALLKCLAAAFPDRLGRRLSPATGRVLLVHARRADLAADSTVRRAELLVAPELQRVEVRRGQVETRLNLASAIDLQWLRELYPGHLREEREVFYDPELRRVVVRVNLFFLDLPVVEGRRCPADAEQSAICLAREVAAGRLPLKQWNDRVEQWILRLNSLAQWCPELGLPLLDDEQRLPLLEQICHGAGSAREIKERPVLPLVQAWLSAAQQELLLRHAPEQARLSNGRQVRLTYENGLAPFFSARIQDLYDVRECPRIALGRVRLRVKILAPNQRPVQITDDLASFWSEGYPRARKELRGRYPKHEWR